MKKETRKDPLTGEEFFPKKVSQRFAIPENRIKFNNDKANKIRLKRSFIDKPLHQNHRILTEVVGNKNEITVHEQYLLGKGFDYCIVSHYKVQDNKNHPCVYEFMIMILDNKQIKIIRYDRY